jgi:hypothetical protein
MKRFVRLLTSALLAGALGGSVTAWGQETTPPADGTQTLPTTPVPVAPPGTVPAVVPQTPVLGQPLAPYPSPPPYPAPPPPGPPGFDPGPDGWGPYGRYSSPDGYFFDVELFFFDPVVKNHLTNTVTLPSGSSVTIGSYAAKLPWSVSPRFELGWRLPDSLGSFGLSYRFYVSQGSADADLNGLPANLTSRMNLNVFDFDYRTTPYTPWRQLQLSAHVGGRLAIFYYDSTIGSALEQQRESDYFVAAGPHFGGDMEYLLPFLPGVSLFGRADGAVVVGQIQQRFSASTGVESATDTFRRSESVQILHLEAGLGYTPPRFPNWHVVAGYQFEHWWYLGQIDPSRLQLNLQGAFVRSEVNW